MNLVEALSADKSGHDLSQRMFGVVVGVVSNINDPDGLGRVKVKFPWLREEDESQWARIMSLMAGKDRGSVFRPEVDDEVLVLFEHGDMRFPYVIGAVWNGKDTMPSERGSDADNNIRIIKSRSGHMIILDDTSGSEKVTVQDKNGNILEMSSSGVVIKSDAVKVGEGASEALVLGTAFMDLYNNHTHNTGVGPSSPPVSPMVDGTHVSSKHKTL
jgi:uncharacterized protein involved in type VI secretion and phage assembly